MRKTLLILSWLVLAPLMGGVTLASPGTLPSPNPSAAPTAAPSPDVLAVPQALVPDGMPAPPRDLVTRMKPYGSTQAAVFMDWHPERREMLVGARAGETRQLHRVEAPEGKREPITAFAEPVRAARWRPGATPEKTSSTSPASPGQTLAYLADQGGSEFYQVHVYDPRTRQDRMLTDGRSRNQEIAWSRDGRLLAWTGTARNGKDFDVYVAAPDDDAAPRLVHEGKGEWEVLDWSPDGTRLLIRQYVSIRESTIGVLEVATGRATPLPRPEGSTVMDRGAWSKDGRSVYYLGDQGSEFVHVWRHDLATGRSVDLTPALKWDADALEISADGSRLAWVTNEDGTSRLHLADLGGPVEAGLGRRLPAPTLPPAVISRLCFHPRTGELAFDMTSARTPGETWSWDPGQARLTRWIQARATAGLDLKRLPEPTLVRYRSFDGREIPAFVYRPTAPRRGPFPVLISIHGGPEGQHRPAYLGGSNYLVAEMGVAMIFPNVRGSTGYGKTWVDLDNGRRREDAVRDISALIDWIATQPDLDSKRVAVEGGSYGGFMSLATMVRESARLRCGIDVVGISDFVTFLENTQPYRRDLRRVEYGDERDPGMRAYLKRVSPLGKAARIAKPLFVVQGANDPRVPRSEAEQIVREVRRAGHAVWYLLAMNEGHGFARRSNIEFYQVSRALFYSRFLLPVTPP